MKLGFTPFAKKEEVFIIGKQEYETYNLEEWGKNFKLGTAGYRDLLDPEDLFSSEVPFNAVTMAVLAYSRAQVATKHKLKKFHIGGEVRPHTQKFINLFSRIYAAQNMEVHLRKSAKTTPIWLSSFGVFYYGLDGGENFTASHSPSFKGGWKPMNNKGMQLLDMATEITLEVQKTLQIIKNGKLEINLASSDSNLIKHDFEPISAYTYLIKKLISEQNINKISAAFEKGFKLGISTEGGSMGAATRQIFDEFNFFEHKGVKIFHEEENSEYHGIGVLDGINYGVDPGKWQVYKYVGAQNLLRNNEVDLFFIWDPDGDRFNIVTSAPASIKNAAENAGLEIENLDNNRILVYFKPNQIYFMLTEFRIKNTENTQKPWIAAITYPTSRSITEVAEKAGSKYNLQIKTLKVPVGFKHFGNMTIQIENAIRQNKTATFTDVMEKTHNLGKNPGILIMAEESGGAATGTSESILNYDKSDFSIALKEKDGMQVGILVLSLAVELYDKGKSFAEHYIELMEKYDIKYKYYERQDIMLYDESLRGEERKSALEKGNLLKNKIVNFFKSLTDISLKEANEKLNHASKGEFNLKIKNAFWAGDGTVLEFEDYWFEIRASGTDAVLRYYMEGKNRENLHKLNTILTKLDI